MKMGKVYLTSFCLCLTIHRGSLFTGIAFLIISTLEVLYCINLILARIYGPDEEAHWYLGTNVPLVISLLLLKGVHIASCCGLIHGVRQELTRYILPWLVWSVIDVPVVVVGSVPVVFSCWSAGTGFFLLCLILLISLSALLIYCYACVLSYYNQLKSDSAVAPA